MSTTISDLLAKKLPPTPEDQRMTREHTTGSITHQIRHMTDHGKAGADQLKKLHVVDVKKAHSQKKRLLNSLDQLHKVISTSLPGAKA